ncbi:MAG TPA: hypothetical protein VGQ30_08830 [Gemmatimonadaceae bacterium]|jgi:hypothetical protein|nr:hypothetical protein [Gemmatimonadaceae bacterium]
MRISGTQLTLGAAISLATARTALAAQDVKVDVSTPATHTVWYADPVWIGVGAVAVVLIIILAVAASRKGDGKSTTTVIR